MALYKQKQNRIRLLRCGVISVVIGLCGLLVVFFTIGQRTSLPLLKSIQSLNQATIDILSGNYMLLVYPSLSFIAAFLLVMCLLLKPIQKENPLTKIFINMIGDYSFELYLFHYPVALVVKTYVTNGFLSFCLGLIFTIFTAYFARLFVRWITLLLQKYRNRF